jgi:Zn-dependent protease/CBS domain-containing protein
MAHSLMARARGLRVLGITLYLFGGVSEIEEEANNAKDELRVTIVGPLTSFALAGIFGILWLGLRGTSDLAGSALGYLAVINLLLGVFNLLPGLPLDGGRVLHSLVWLRTGDKTRATRVAVRTGVLLGYVMIAAGIFWVFGGFWLNGLWMIFLGWYLQSMAAQEWASSQTRKLFEGMRVADLVQTNVHAIAPDTRLDDVVDEIMMRYQARVVPVVGDGVLQGLVTIEGVARVPRDRWPVTTALTVMIPARQVHAVTPEDSVESAIATMQQEDVNQLVVLRGEELVGIINRGTIIRQLEMRQELSKAGGSATKRPEPTTV